MYGAGSIGRGFIGPLFSDSGCEVCFVDVDRELVEKLDSEKCYEITIADIAGYEIRTIGNVRAVNGSDSEKVAKEIAACDVMSTAVGVNILPFIAENIAKGLDLRAGKSGRSLDIIVCENMSGSGEHLKSLVEPFASDGDYLNESVGFVAASVGRMVPLPPEKASSGIIVEPYNRLPVNGDAAKTDLSKIKNIFPTSPFAIEEHKKYFMHNMSHAVTAYLGYLKGYQFIWEAMGDPWIARIASGALDESTQAIGKIFDTPMDRLKGYATDLLKRYANPYLMDTVARVGRDPGRKLSKNGRLTGAAGFCMDNGIFPENILYGIAAAFKFNYENDVSAPEVSSFVSRKGIEKAIIKYTGIKKQSPLFREIVKKYENL